MSEATLKSIEDHYRDPMPMMTAAEFNALHRVCSRPFWVKARVIDAEEYAAFLDHVMEKLEKETADD